MLLSGAGAHTVWVSVCVNVLVCVRLCVGGEAASIAGDATQGAGNGHGNGSRTGNGNGTGRRGAGPRLGLLGELLAVELMQHYPCSRVGSEGRAAADDHDG